MVNASDFRFGPFRLDTINGYLLRGSEKSSLLPKDLAVLLILLNHPGSLVTKTDILEAVWRDISVSDDVLKTCIKRIRKLLADDHRTPQYIETVHRRGYRFICPVIADGATENCPMPMPKVFSIPLLVGRDHERILLEERLDLACNGLRQIIFLVGEAGIGKTTLLNAFRALAKARCNMMATHGQCIEHHGPREPYRPILEALDRLCDGEWGPETVTCLRKFAPAWLLQMPWLISKEEEEELRNRLDGATPGRMLRELAVTLEALSHELPVVLFIEDLHWADAATLDALNHIARRHEPARLMIMGSFRPDVLSQTEHPLHHIIPELQAHDYCRVIQLSFLTQADLSHLISLRYSVEQPPHGLCEWLYRYTEGNPLFVKVLLDHAVSQGWLKADEVLIWSEPVADRPDNIIPKSLSLMICKQLAQLNPAEREVLDAASVFGLTFPIKILAGSDEEEAAMDEICHRLSQKGHIIQFAGHQPWPPADETPYYRFIHSIYQQAVYEAISPVRLRSLHRRIGQRLETAYIDRLPEVTAALSLHFDRSQDTEKAALYCQLAGEIACSRYAPFMDLPKIH